MLIASFSDIEKPYALHRLGITMHVYADTFAHQGFAGINHKMNEVENLTSNDKKRDRSFVRKIANYFLSESFPLGHGPALSYPDAPNLVWEYENGLGEKVKRNNPEIFVSAVDNMCKAMQCFRESNREMNLEIVDGLPTKDAKKILSLIKSIKSDSEAERHKRWLQEIERGSFSFGGETINYIPKGVGSWKHRSIGQVAYTDTGREIFKFKKSFFSSNWKLFHDALQVHSLDILHDILPKYGICAV